MLSSFDALLKIEVDARDAEWERAFLREFPRQNVRVLSPEPQQGPDGWPYLFVETGGRADELARGPLDWLATRGIGMAINPAGGAPDFVVTYGMAWNFRERGEFLTAAGPGQKEGAIEIRAGQSVFTGVPSEGYLPKYVRQILRQFFLDQGAFAPKIMMVGSDPKADLDLGFSIESIGSPPEREHAGMLEALSWFLPQHYGLALLSDKAVPGQWSPL